MIHGSATVSVGNPEWYIPDPATNFKSSDFDPNYFKNMLNALYSNQ